MSDAYMRTPKGLFETILAKIGSLEERLGRTPSTRGATALRDAIFGMPSTDAARVALANQQVTWFNTDKGWQESYYATTGLAGLVVPGLIAGHPAGWYPISGATLPYGDALFAADQSVPSGEATLNLNAGRLRGGVTFSANGLFAPIGGHYDVRAQAYTWDTPGAGTYRGVSAYVAGVRTAEVNISGRWSMISPTLRVPVKAGDKMTAVTSGDSAMWMRQWFGNNALSIAYAGPPLA